MVNFMTSGVPFTSVFDPFIISKMRKSSGIQGVYINGVL